MASPEDMPPFEYRESGFRGRSIVIGIIVCAVVWWFSSAAEVKLYLVVAASGLIDFSFPIMQATFIEYGVMLIIWVVIALGLRFGGHSEFLWPCMSAGIVGALNGMGGRESRMAWARHAAAQNTEEKEPTD